MLESVRGVSLRITAAYVSTSEVDNRGASGLQTVATTAEMSGRYAARDADNAARAVRDILESSRDNGVCADCSAPNPEYLNLTIGTFVCEQCADVHRNSSNRRIKDMFGRNLTGDDVRRMRDVGNEVANRKFLARWNPNEFPEPDPTDKEMLREFIWLKYEGSWKKSAPAPPPSSQPLRRDRREYLSRAHGGRPYGDEPEYGPGHLQFREPLRPSDHSGRPSYWADRFGHTVSDPHSDRSGAGQLSRDAEYSRPGLYHQQRLSPAPASGPGYRRRAPPPRSAAYDGPSLDEEYAPIDAGVYHGGPRRGSANRFQERRQENTQSATRKKKSSGGRNTRSKTASTASDTDDSELYSSSDASDAKRGKGRDFTTRRSREKGKSSKRRTRRSEVEPGSDSDADSDDSGKRVSRRGKKSSASHETDKKRKEKHRRSKNASSDSEEFSSNSDSHRRLRNGGAAVSRKAVSKKVNSAANPFASDEEGAGNRAETTANYSDGVQAVGTGVGGAEFDLMSEWMGTETDAATTSSSVGNAASAQPGMPSASVMHPGQHPVPPMMPPMSVYPGMMPMPMAMFPPPPGGMMIPPGGMYQSPMQFQPQQGQFSGHMQPPLPQMINPLVSGMQNMGLYGQSPGPHIQQSPLPPPPPPQASNDAGISSQVVPPRPAGPPPPE